MPIPAPKSLDDVFNILNECITRGRELGDMDRHRIRCQLQEMLDVWPSQALVCAGMLATLENDESAMRESFRKALSYGEQIATINIDFAISLMKFGHYEESIEVLSQYLQAGCVSPKHLDEVACTARELNNPELSEKILRLADKLNIHSQNLRLLAMDMLLSISDSSEDEANLLEKIFPQETLKNNSIQLTDNEWREMQNFAHELKQYL